MSDVKEFKELFGKAFADEGVINVKFFVRPNPGSKFSDFAKEACCIQNAISDGAFSAVESVDANLSQQSFDELF